VEGAIFEEEFTGEEATEQLGSQLASLLRKGDLVALHGELGAGKTCLVRGLSKGLGLKEGLVASPSYSLINEYPGPVSLFHIDCYRLHLEEEIEELGLEEYMDGRGITAIEWAERINHLPDDRLEISIRITGPTGRLIRIEAYGEIAQRMEGYKLKLKSQSKRKPPRSTMRGINPDRD
jgi:tRNA threonylcarbamoyladenosine biosynthesis protein TsaE